jgi:cell wall-associated NlpC family hydrolase
MERINCLFLIVLSGLIAGGCATYPPAPVVEARPGAAEPASPERPVAQSAPVARSVTVAPPASATIASAPRPSARSPEMLFAALAAAGFDYKRSGGSMASGFDCSGLVAHVFREAYGVLLPHSSAAQSTRGTAVAREALEPGDLVFFNTEQRPFSHVGIYLGEQRFIHAPRPGAVVRTENMRLAYWQKRFDGARRIVE